MAQAGPLNIKLTNATLNVNTLYVYILGQDKHEPYRDQYAFLRADGKTLYHPPNPENDGTPLGDGFAIPVGGPKNSVQVTIPRYLDGARIYMCLNNKLEFFLNKGKDNLAKVVEPSLTNNSDHNISKLWDFCEFAWNDVELFANISYVDLVCIPVALTLTTTDDATQKVLGMDGTGLNKVVQGLLNQHKKDNLAWDKLIIYDSGTNKPFRVLSPNQYVSVNSSAFQYYYDKYIGTVWEYYKTHELIVDTQMEAGKVSGKIEEDGQFTFTWMIGDQIKAIEKFIKPTSHDVLSSSTGPFDSAGASDFRKALLARLAAAFNRTVLLLSTETPDGTRPDQYYKSNPTNHYSDIVHKANLDLKGYGFPYDDVAPTGDHSIAGEVRGQPKLWTISIGGNGEF